MTRGWSGFVKIPHAETGGLCGGLRLADFVRSHVSRLAVHRSGTADEPSTGRCRLQLRGTMAELARTGGGACVPDVHGGRRVSVPAGRHRRPLHAARLSASRHSPSYPLTQHEAASDSAVRHDWPPCRQRRYRYCGYVHRLLAALLGLSSTPPNTIITTNKLVTVRRLCN